MPDLTEIIGDIIDELTPIHEAEAIFMQGGPACARAIARIYERLRDAESRARYLEGRALRLDELEDELEAVEDVLKAAEQQAASAGARP